MSHSHEAIAKAARWTRWIVVALIAASILLQLGAFFTGSPHYQLHPSGHTFSGAAIMLLHTLFMLLAIAQLWLMLRAVEKGDLFSPAVTMRLRRFALYIVLAVFSAALLMPILSLLFPDCANAHHCIRRLSVDVRTFWTLVIALVFFLVARILDEARRIDEDNRQII
jgi:hypothetical protein